MDWLDVHPPHGPAWQLLVVSAVILLGPLLLDRLHVPRLVGLLLGGAIIGPNVTGLIGDGTGIVRDLGSVGLLYLMFLAGLELDLDTFGRYRRQALGFSALTFVWPFGLAVGAGSMLGFDLPAALLLGSLFASYTLVSYPIVRDKGLSRQRAVAVTVGATAITDVVALVVLAVIAGNATGSGGGVGLVASLSIGLGAVLLHSFVLLPRLVGRLFDTIGRSATIRYVLLLGAMFSAAELAEVFGIEAIVGAFFAGLGMNRLVPNEGEFMERVEFFGSALLVPLFLVSVGTVVDPVVMARPATLVQGALFVVACLGGKYLAALLSRPTMGFSRDEVGVAFGLSVAQAAATLAAAFVGLEVGLFTTTTVNAVMIVIVVSLVAASLATERASSRIAAG